MNDTRRGAVMTLIAILATVLTASGARGGPVILVQDEAYPPYMATIDGKPAGIYADIIAEAARRLSGFDIELQSVPWTRAVGLVKNGVAHGLVGTYHKPDDRPWIGTYSHPLFGEEVSVFCRKGIADPSWAYPRDYAGLTFGNTLGYRAPGPEFFEMVADGKIVLDEAETSEQNLRKIMLGRVDCYVVERLATELLIRDNGFDAVERIRHTSMELAFIGYRSSWTDPDAVAFIAAMDEALRSMKADGTIDRIVAGLVPVN